MRLSGSCVVLRFALSQENPNYSFLLPFAQYNLQCPGYYLPVLQGKWVYPHSNSTCRIWNKIISYSAITRDPHRGGWVVGRAGRRQVAFFGALAKGDVSSSIALAGRGFLPKSCPLIKYSPLCNIQTETFLQNPIHTFLPCVPKFMSDIFCGCGMLRKETQLFVIGWGLLRPQDEWRLSWVISVTDQAFN